MAKGKMVIKARENLVSAWAFLIGVILAILIGIIQTRAEVTMSSWVYAILIILGLVIGFSNISTREVDRFLIAAVVLVVVSYMGSEGLVKIAFMGIPLGHIIVSVLTALLTMFVPATILVALKALFAISKV